MDDDRQPRLPALSTERQLSTGDVLWTDAGISYAGFHSDFGRTWVVGRGPDARQRAQFDGGGRSWTPSSTSPGPGRRGRT